MKSLSQSFKSKTLNNYILVMVLSENIFKLIKNILIDKKLLMKKMTY